MNFQSALKYLVPNGVWLKRTVLLFSFIFLDYIVTLVFCKSPYAEGNLIARGFMQTYGIAAGLTFFDLLMSAPIYIILCVDSHLIKYTQQHATKAEFLIDLAFGWTIAGTHFNGAASWLWDASGITRQALGFIIYEAVALLSLYSFSKLAYPRSLFKLNPVKRKQ